MNVKSIKLSEIVDKYSYILNTKILPDQQIIDSCTIPMYDEYIIEVRAGVGGDEADLFCEEMFNLYVKAVFEFTDKKNILIDSSDYMISVKDRYMAFLIFETGTYRVQRVPKTEKSGRLHTSTISVSVIGIDNISRIKSIPEKDLKIEACKSSGPGGQHVQKSSTKIELTHIPTKIKATCQSQRSQVQNKEYAMQILIMRLNKYYEEQLVKKMDSQRNVSADRSAKVATINDKRNEIVDHRTGYSANLDIFQDQPYKVILERSIIYACSTSN